MQVDHAGQDVVGAIRHAGGGDASGATFVRSPRASHSSSTSSRQPSGSSAWRANSALMVVLLMPSGAYPLDRGAQQFAQQRLHLAGQVGR
jgi:hypothetical protein